MTIKALRTGETASYWKTDSYDEKLNVGISKRTRIPQDELIIFFGFKMRSKGGGVTNAQLEVSSESFEHLAKAMMDANEDAAIRAFGSALFNKSQNASDSN